MPDYEKKFNYKDLIINVEIEEDFALVNSRTSLCNPNYPDSDFPEDEKKANLWRYWRYSARVYITDKNGNPCNGYNWRSVSWIYDDGSTVNEPFLGIDDYIGEFMSTELIEIPDKIRLYKNNGSKVEFDLY